MTERYIIEINQEETALPIIRDLDRQGKISIIQSEDPVIQLTKQIHKIKEALETLVNAGIDKDVMISYIRSKGVSKKQIEQILFYQKEFLEKLGLEND